MRKAIIILICLLIPFGFSHVVLAAPEPDTEAFLTDHFDLQEQYSRVLCVEQGTPCPPEITTAVPCLTDGCSNPSLLYDVHSTYGTIQAASDAALPGDLIIIMPGTYTGVEVEDKHGANNAYIHFLGWGDPGTIIVNDEPGSYRHHFYFINTHHYIIQNIAFANANEGAGLFFSGYFNATGKFSHHLIVMDVYSHDNYKWGLHTTQASYMVIQDSVFTGSTDEHGAYISGGGDHFLIRRNVFQGNVASGLQVNADPQTATAELFYYLQNETGDTCGWDEADVEFQGEATWQDLKACYDSQSLPNLGEYIDDGISKDLIIEQNITTGNGEVGGGAINLASVRQSVIRNNLAYGNLAGSITCWDNAYADDKGLPNSVFGCATVTVVNNTVVEESGNRSAVVFMNDARSMTVYNNIIVRERSDAYEISARSGTDLRSGANYYYALDLINSPGKIIIDTDAGSGSITNFTISEALANFVSPNTNEWVLLGGAWPQLNPNRPDFHPLPNSILAQMANLTYMPATDIDGDVRSAPVIGAYGLDGDPVEPGPNLLLNSSFEDQGTNPKLAANWNLVNAALDRRKCNPTTLLGHGSACAYHFTGTAKRTTKLTQNLLSGEVLSQDVLVVKFWVKASNLKGSAKLSVRVRYTDDTPPSFHHIKINPGTYAYVQKNGVMNVASAPVLDARVQIMMKNGSGWFRIDDVSLSRIEAPALVSSPLLSSLPLPMNALPDPLRGQ